MTYNLPDDSTKAFSEGSTLSGVLLIGGTSIGAGMLALPAITGMAGFLPAMAVNFLCWGLMMATGLLFLEATLWMEKGSNLLTTSFRLLGPFGKWIAGAAFIFLYYCLLVSYIAGGTPIFFQSVNEYSALAIDGTPAYVLFACLFGGITYFGHLVVDRVNWILMISLIVSYILLVLLGSTEIVSAFLLRQEWSLTLAAAPILFCAYGYHNVIPSLCSYLNKNVAKLRLAVVIGTLIPFVVYSFWQWMIIGSLPYEQIQAAIAHGIPITFKLQEITGNPFLSILGAYFGFFALVTSFLGVSLSMVDFLRDGLALKYRASNQGILCACVFIPPAFFAAYHPDIFVEALGVAGGIGEALLNGLFPIAMVWMGRYKLKLGGPVLLPGGRWVLVLLALFTCLIMGVEIHHLWVRFG